MSESDYIPDSSSDTSIDNNSVDNTNNNNSDSDNVTTNNNEYDDNNDESTNSTESILSISQCQQLISQLLRNDNNQEKQHELLNEYGLNLSPESFNSTIQLNAPAPTSNNIHLPLKLCNNTPNTPHNDI